MAPITAISIGMIIFIVIFDVRYQFLIFLEIIKIVQIAVFHQ
jgi:hypothetical protein